MHAQQRTPTWPIALETPRTPFSPARDENDERFLPSPFVQPPVRSACELACLVWWCGALSLVFTAARFWSFRSIARGEWEATLLSSFPSSPYLTSLLLSCVLLSCVVVPCVCARVCELRKCISTQQESEQQGTEAVAVANAHRGGQGAVKAKQRGEEQKTATTRRSKPQTGPPRRFCLWSLLRKRGSRAFDNTPAP